MWLVARLYQIEVHQVLSNRTLHRQAVPLRKLWNKLQWASLHSILWARQLIPCWLLSTVSLQKSCFMMWVSGATATTVWDTRKPCQCLVWVLFILLPIQLSVDVHTCKHIMAQAPVYGVPVTHTRTCTEAPGFGLFQFQLLQVFRKWTSRREPSASTS